MRNTQPRIAPGTPPNAPIGRRNSTPLFVGKSSNEELGSDSDDIELDPETQEPQLREKGAQVRAWTPVAKQEQRDTKSSEPLPKLIPKNSSEASPELVPKNKSEPQDLPKKSANKGTQRENAPKALVLGRGSGKPLDAETPLQIDAPFAQSLVLSEVLKGGSDKKTWRMQAGQSDCIFKAGKGYADITDHLTHTQVFRLLNFPRVKVPAVERLTIPFIQVLGPSLFHSQVPGFIDILTALGCDPHSGAMKSMDAGPPNAQVARKTPGFAVNKILDLEAQAFRQLLCADVSKSDQPLQPLFFRLLVPRLTKGVFEVIAAPRLRLKVGLRLSELFPHQVDEATRSHLAELSEQVKVEPELPVVADMPLVLAQQKALLELQTLLERDDQKALLGLCISIMTVGKEAAVKQAKTELAQLASQRKKLTEFVTSAQGVETLGQLATVDLVCGMNDRILHAFNGGNFMFDSKVNCFWAIDNAKSSYGLCPLDAQKSVIGDDSERAVNWLNFLQKSAWTGSPGVHQTFGEYLTQLFFCLPYRGKYGYFRLDQPPDSVRRIARTLDRKINHTLEDLKQLAASAAGDPLLSGQVLNTIVQRSTLTQQRILFINACRPLSEFAFVPVRPAPAPKSKSSQAKSRELELVHAIMQSAALSAGDSALLEKLERELLNVPPGTADRDRDHAMFVLRRQRLLNALEKVPRSIPELHVPFSNVANGTEAKAGLKAHLAEIRKLWLPENGPSDSALAKAFDEAGKHLSK